MKDSVAAPEAFRTLNRRFNGPAALHILLVIFVVTAIVFSALPLLRYFRGRTLFDYKLWYETGQHVLAGHEIYFFRSGKYDFMYPPPCALFLAGASLLGQGGLILLLVAITSAGWFCSARLTAILAGGDNGAPSQRRSTETLLRDTVREKTPHPDPLPSDGRGDSRCSCLIYE